MFRHHEKPLILSCYWRCICQWWQQHHLQYRGALLCSTVSYDLLQLATSKEEDSIIVIVVAIIAGSGSGRRVVSVSLKVWI